MSENLAVIISIGIYLVLFYLVLQFGIFGIYLNNILDEFTEERYSTDENGLFYRDKKTWWHRFCFLGKHLYEMFIERQYVLKTARYNAMKSKYGNCFAETRIQKLYDAAFKEKRMKMIVKAAKTDAKSKRVRKFSITEAEQAIYQEEYLNALLKNMFLDEILNKRSQELYNDHKSNEPIDFKKFKEYIEAA